MFISKKIQWLCLINPYKHLCTSDIRLHNLQYACNINYKLSSYIFCFNMRTKHDNNKLIRKKSKLKMASFNSDRSNLKASTSSKELKDVLPEKPCSTGRDPSTVSVSKSSKSSGRRKRDGSRSKESIKSTIRNDREQCKSSQHSICDQQRTTAVVALRTPVIQSFIANFGPLNLPFSYYNPDMFGNLGNSTYLQCYPQLQQSRNYVWNFMCRSDDMPRATSNDTEVEHDRKLLQQWRSWQKTTYSKSFEKLIDQNGACVLTVMSYNVLAQDLLTSHHYLYKYHKPDALSWEQRWKNLLFEIKQHNADILCLQEVQSTHLETHYSQLRKLGYDGVYKQRTGDVTNDGCAIYYKSSVLKLIDYTTVEFNQPNVFVLNRNNVGIIAKFAPIQNTENAFVVATTHLLYNPRREDVRLAQTQVLLAEIDRIAFKKINEEISSHLPVIITGDFNFVPNSPVYKLITQGRLRYENLASKTLLPMNVNNTRENLTGKYLLPAALGITDQCQHAELRDKRRENNVADELQHVYLFHSERFPNYNDSKRFDKALFSSGVISHHLALKSAYEHRRGNDVEATTFQNKWVTVDYIFYSGTKNIYGLVVEDKLNLLSRYTIPTSEKLQGITIPNMAVGSDHFSLVVKFKLNP